MMISGEPHATATSKSHITTTVYYLTVSIGIPPYLCAVLQLQHDVVSEGEALATEHPVTVGGWPGQIFLPGPHPAVLSPFNGGPRALEPPPVDRALGFTSNHDWGYLNSATGPAQV